MLCEFYLITTLPTKKGREGQRSWTRRTLQSTACTSCLPLSQSCLLSADYLGQVPHYSTRTSRAWTWPYAKWHKQQCPGLGTLITPPKVESPGPVYLTCPLRRASRLTYGRKLSVQQSTTSVRRIIGDIYDQAKLLNRQFSPPYSSLTWQPISISATWDFEEAISKFFPSFLGLAKNVVILPDVKLKQQLRAVQCSGVGGQSSEPSHSDTGQLLKQKLLHPRAPGLQCVCAHSHVNMQVRVHAPCCMPRGLNPHSAWSTHRAWL